LLLSSPPYNWGLFPKYAGSGGGFFLKELTEVSAGGGIINIQVDQLNLQNSNFLANGVGGIQGGGGGSGGSIAIDFTTLNMMGMVNITANGGTGKSSGGGGRVRFYYHNWTAALTTNGLSFLMIQANGGANCDGGLTCGQNGSVNTAPCPPGYQLDYTSYACVSCPVGYYQLVYGYENCQPCASRPANSHYQLASSAMFNNYSSVCTFSCDTQPESTPPVIQPTTCTTTINAFLPSRTPWWTWAASTFSSASA
jgi:hypothetical protein